MAPKNPTPHQYQKSVPWVMWEVVTGVEETYYGGLLQHYNGYQVFPRGKAARAWC